MYHEMDIPAFVEGRVRPRLDKTLINILNHFLVICRSRFLLEQIYISKGVGS